MVNRSELGERRSANASSLARVKVLAQVRTPAGGRLQRHSADWFDNHFKSSASSAVLAQRF